MAFYLRGEKREPHGVGKKIPSAVVRRSARADGTKTKKWSPFSQKRIGQRGGREKRSGTGKLTGQQ